MESNKHKEELDIADIFFDVIDARRLALTKLCFVKLCDLVAAGKLTLDSTSLAEKSVRGADEMLRLLKQAPK